MDWTVSFQTHRRGPDTCVLCAAYSALPARNTYAVIPGHISDEVVLVGNHRDAWVSRLTSF